MTHYNSVNVKLSNYQLNKLKSSIKNKTGVTSRFSSNMINESNDETDFSHKVILTKRRVLKLRKAFDNNLSTDIKFSKTQLSTMEQSGGFFDTFFGSLLKTGLLLMKNELTSLAKIVLITFGSKSAASAANAGIH